VGREEGGLFYLLQDLKVSSKPFSLYTTCFNSIKTSLSDVWHYRLGHPSFTQMHLLHNKFPEISCNSHDIYTVCSLARQHRLPFPIHTSVSCMPFEIIHCHIWGPMATSSTNVHVTFLLLLMIIPSLLGFT
jgi:hypothetical protein